jgi:hypothetical protein
MPSEGSTKISSYTSSHIRGNDDVANMQKEKKIASQSGRERKQGVTIPAKKPATKVPRPEYPTWLMSSNSPGSVESEETSALTGLHSLGKDILASMDMEKTCLERGGAGKKNRGKKIRSMPKMNVSSHAATNQRPACEMNQQFSEAGERSLFTEEPCTDDIIVDLPPTKLAGHFGNVHIPCVDA